MPPTSLTPKSKTSVYSYSTLRKQVEQTLLLGQRKIEAAKVETYWHTGRLIREHILHHNSRQETYGRQVIERLSEDLEVSASVLWRCLQFAQRFEILAARRESFPAQLSWTHYRQLITIPDKETRISLMQRAEKSGWSSQELAEKIRQEVTFDSAGEKTAKLTPRPFKLIPRRGELYTYRLIAPDSVHKEEESCLWIDLGFQVHRQIPANTKGFKETDIIESRKKDDEYSLYTTDRTPESLFTYQAFIERIVDADTLLVKIDLGFETRIRQYLRLRGIDAPELSTAEGKKARDFVKRKLANVAHIILTSSHSDKYDRYLADVFYDEPAEEVYLNQRLLDEALAEPYSSE